MNDSLAQRPIAYVTVGDASTSQPQTMSALLNSAVERHGDREALIDDKGRMSFRELVDACRDAARAFIASGMTKGDRIAIWAPNVREFVIAAAGFQTIGAVLVPLNTRFKGTEAADILRRSGARLLLTVSDFLGQSFPAMLEGQALPDLESIVLLRGSAPPGNLITWQAFLSAGQAVNDTQVDTQASQVLESDILDLMFTSGTTGRSKAAISTHGKSMRAYWMYTHKTTLCPDDRYLIINPFFHTFGYKYGWMSCLMSGACMLPVTSFDPEVAMALIERERVTLMPAPPTVYQMLLQHPRRRDFDLSSLRMGQTGASNIPQELIHTMYRELGLKTVLTGYGLTESCGIATCTDMDAAALTVSTTVGRACPGVEIRIADEKGRSLPACTKGEILLRGDNIMAGYFDDPAATAEAIDAEGFLHTGDVGVLDEDGNLRITDRLKDIYIVGGFNCYPAEIENMLCGMPGVAQAAVIGVPDERLGEVGMAFIVLKSNMILTEAAVIAWSREHIANFKVPRYVRFVDSLPVNASGKVLKTSLRAQIVA